MGVKKDHKLNEPLKVMLINIQTPATIKTALIIKSIK